MDFDISSALLPPPSSLPLPHLFSSSSFFLVSYSTYFTSFHPSCTPHTHTQGHVSYASSQTSNFSRSLFPFFLLSLPPPWHHQVARSFSAPFFPLPWPRFSLPWTTTRLQAFSKIPVDFYKQIDRQMLDTNARLKLFFPRDSPFRKYLWIKRMSIFRCVFRTRTFLSGLSRSQSRHDSTFKIAWTT